MVQKIILRLVRFSVFVQNKLTDKQFIYLSSVFVGILASTAVILLKTFTHGVFSFASYFTKSSFDQYGFIKVLLPIIGILLTVFVIKRFLGGSIDKGTSQILYAIAKKSSIIPEKQMYAQIVTSSLTVGFGGSAGLESPIVITGAAFGSNYAQNFNLSYKDRTLLIGCGVAAGIAAAFNAPIAGVLFAVEVLLVDMSIAAFTPIMISAATGALVSMITLDQSILLSFGQQKQFDFYHTPFYVGLGIFSGLFAVYYSRNFQRVEVIFSRLRLSDYKKALFGATILSILIFIFPTLFGEGYESIKVLSDDNSAKLLQHTIFSKLATNKWLLLLFIGMTTFVKVFATAITIGSGGNGGNFAPSLFLGSYLGYFFAKLLNMLGLSSVPVSNFTLVGMAGILSGLFHAPLTAIFLIAEITGGYALMIPLMIVTSISFAISKKFEKHPFDTKSLARKGNAFTSNKDSNILSTLDTNAIIQTDYMTVAPNENLEKLVDLISHSNQVIFAVVNLENEIVGIVNFNNVRGIIFNQFRVKHTFVKEIMTSAPVYVYPTDSMETVMNKFERSKARFLPVTKHGKYYGFISKSKVLEAYRSRLKSMTVE